MKDNWIKKGLVFAVIILFIGVSCSSAISVDTKTSVINNQSEKNKPYVDPNIHLTRTNLPILKRSFKYFKNSNFYDAGIGKVMEQIINLIEFKGEVNSKDVENILINNGITSIDVYNNCKIVGKAIDGAGRVFPLLLFEFATWSWSHGHEMKLIGIGGYLRWGAWILDVSYPDINITVGSTSYTNPHTGEAFGFFGRGYVEFFPFDTWLHLNGRASIVFVRT
jgi:hypothetical protein